MIDRITALHLSNRLGFGPAPGDVEHIAGMGLDSFLEIQLHPQTANLPQSVVSTLRGLPSFGMNSADAYAEYWWKGQVADPKAIPKDEKKQLNKREKQVTREAQIARLARAVGSPWQLQEALVEFWFNHFNIYEKKGPDRVWIGSYEEEAIRPHTLGRFSDLLLATAKHPAMLFYLDNSQNVAPVKADPDAMPGTQPAPAKKKENGINENFAREVMELHTLGVDSGYTQADVISLAHILTGWTVGPGEESQAAIAAEKFGNNKGAFRFARRRHDPSTQSLLGHSYSGDDVTEGESALLMLAAHPATARHISFQLAQYFVADKPDPKLVAAMVSTFRNSDGDIRAVLKTMLTNAVFLAPANFGTKFKTPYRYVVSAARAVGMDPSAVRPLIAALQNLGQPLYGCVTPDGYACTESAWLDPDGLLHRIAFATRLGDGEYGASQSTDGGSGLPDSDRLQQMLEPVLSKTTLAAVARTSKDRRAGVILGSPEFMRC